uniref:FAD-binding domain-containing protein n=1 Tax=Aegilops tauschii subsp. strangulata TaxID=200361 RepID=A0A453G3R3_AEGTS
MPSIAGGLFSAGRGISWLRLRRLQRPLLSSLSAGGGSDAPHLPVVIVGAGPVGLALSFLLAKFGIKCTVLERSMEFTRHPRAHFINNRTMEIFRKFDGLAGDIERAQPPVDLWRKFIYCTSLSGSILGSVDHMKQEDFDKVVSPISVAHFSQYKLVDLLLKKLDGVGFQTCFPDELGGSSAQDLLLENKILMGHECSSIELTDDGILVGASFNNGGRMQERKLHCGLLLGADGARSKVRELAGISMKGERDLQQLVSVHFVSRDLGKYLSSERPGMLFFIFNPDAIGVLVAHDLEHGEFVLQVCEQIIVKLVGWEPADIQVLDIKPWAMHAEVAEKYVGCDNRVILVGDAAHRFPPAGGFGMNTGVQDAHNLAWKLCLLLNGIADPSIIQTYESERKPVATFNTELSLENFKAAMSIPATLGLDPTIANSVHRVINSSLGSIIPRNLQKVVLEGLFSIGRTQVSDYILSENNPLGSLRLARLRSILDEGKSLQLQFPAEDLGFRYGKGALVAEDCAESTYQAEDLKHSKRSSGEYIPSAKVGSRLPHMLVRPLSASSEGVFSTLDLVSGDKIEFVIIIAPLKESYKLAQAMLRIADEFELSSKVCVMWPQGSRDVEAKGSISELAPWTNYVDVEEIPRATVNSSWWEMYQVSNRSVILVRPDEHIAWRTEPDMVRDAYSDVRRVFSQILSLNRPQV